MSGDWIKMRCDLHGDPAVFRLSEMTKLNRDTVVGKLFAFWAWASGHAVNGRVDGATSTVVDDVVRHKRFGEALLAVGWLVIGDGYIEIPNHDRHNSESAKERALKNARQSRWRKHVDGKTSTSPSTATPTNASTREEKRREEKNINLNQSQKQRGANAPPRAAKEPNSRRLPADWTLPDSWREWTTLQRPDWDEQTMLRVSLEFRDHWLSKGERRADWLATWRNWVRRERTAARVTKRLPTLAEQRAAGYDAITGKSNYERDITTTSTRVDSATIHPLPIGVRIEGRDDVGEGGEGEPGRFASGVG